MPPSGQEVGPVKKRPTSVNNVAWIVLVMMFFRPPENTNRPAPENKVLATGDEPNLGPAIRFVFLVVKGEVGRET